MQTKLHLLTATLLNMLLPVITYAQFNFTGQYMNRAEYRHGYGTLSTNNQLAAFFISQRARLGAEYVADKYKLVLSAQDIRTWGSTANGTIDAAGLLSIYEAYGQLIFNKKLNLKLGRQAISYDDDRIFGSLDWAMQGRRHDAAILQYNDSTFSAHLGTAYNANGETPSFVQYAVASNYQNFQYLWLNKIRGKFNSSFLFLNNGVVSSKDALIAYSQTAGLRTEYKNEKYGAVAYFYYQLGQDAARKTLNAYAASAEIFYKPVKAAQLTLGGELLTGTSQTDTTTAYKNENHSFNPLYGTNHRFNGYMDYFYVGNHVNSVGLIDLYFKACYTHKKLLSSVNVHHFEAAAPVKDKSSANPTTAMNAILGTEIDITFSYNISDNVALQAGYSQMFGSSTLVALRGGQLAQSSNWTYASVLIRPGKNKWPKTGLKM